MESTLRHAHQVSPESAVILMKRLRYEAAVEAVKGRRDRLHRKSTGLVDEVKLAIARSLTRFRSAAEFCAAPHRRRQFPRDIIGVSPAIEKLKQTIRTVATTSSTILIYGESGTEKSWWRERCIPVRRAMPKPSFRSTAARSRDDARKRAVRLVKGAFTGARRTAAAVRSGGPRHALLDEIGEMARRCR